MQPAVQSSRLTAIATHAADVLAESVLAAAMLSMANALAPLGWGIRELAAAAACWMCGLLLSRAASVWPAVPRWLAPALEWGVPVLLVKIFSGALMSPSFERTAYTALLIMVLVRIWRWWMKRCDRDGVDRHAETLRTLLIVAATGWALLPFFNRQLVGGTDALWYAGMFSDFVEQSRAGVFPAIGQGDHAFNGTVNLFRSAPLCLWVAGAWDWATLRVLTPVALQHLSLISSGVAATLGMYTVLLLLLRTSVGERISSWQRWMAALIAVNYSLCPGLLTVIYCYELQMTFTAAAMLPWIFYGNVRILRGADGRGYVILAAALTVTLMGHPPLAIIAMLVSVLLQLGRLIFGEPPSCWWKSALGGGALFVLLAAYYFAGMGELPSSPGLSLYREGLMLVAVVLVTTGLVRGLIWRQWPALLLALGGIALAGWAMPVWGFWAVGFALSLTLLVLAAEYLSPGSARRQAVMLTAVAMIVGAMAASFFVSRLGFRPDEGLSIDFAANARQWTGFFQPISTKLNVLADTQLGFVLWSLLGACFVVGIWRRNLPMALLAAGTLPLLIQIVPVPGASHFVVGFAPWQLANLVNIPLPYRLMPPLAALAAIGGFQALLLGASRRTSMAMVTVVLAVGAVWSAWEVRNFVRSGWHSTLTREQTLQRLDRDNYALGRYTYGLTAIPTYFIHGRMDPRLENRLLNTRREVVVGPDEVARLNEADNDEVLTLRSEDFEMSPGWLRILPGLNLNADETVLLRFEFPPDVDQSGWLVLDSGHTYLEYDLESDPTFAWGFGTGRLASRVIAVSNRGGAPQRVNLSVKMRPGNSMPRDGGEWAKVHLSHYRPDWVQIRLESLVPHYRVWVSMKEAGFVETPRIWLPGYRARLDGKPVDVMESPRHLVMIPANPGGHTVELEFAGSGRLWAGLAVSALCWVGLGFWFLGGRIAGWWERWAKNRETRAAPTLRPADVMTQHCRIWLAAILLISAGLRVVLASRGGQGYWPDEGRYERAAIMASDIHQGNLRAAADTLFQSADHLLFSVVGLAPALLNELIGVSPAAIAIYFGMFSVAAIWLVWRVALAAGAEPREALVAAILTACSSSLFYYARHFFPYDAALCLMLGALWAAWLPWSARRGFLAGLFCGLGFLEYNGYWPLTAAICLVYSFSGTDVRRMAHRAFAAGVGLLTPIVVVLVLARVLGHDLLASFRLNANSITQGDFELGHWVIIDYLWAAEGGLCLFFGAAVVYGGWLIVRSQAELRLKWWLSLVVLIAVSLVVSSDIAHQFVVYGRLVRVLVPFLCLISAYALERRARQQSWTWRPWAVIAVVVAGVAAVNFSPPLRQHFPLEFKHAAALKVRALQRDDPGVYRLVRAGHLWREDLAESLPSHDVILSWPHPLAFRPFQFEGFTASDRAQLARRDLSMQLIRLPLDMQSGESWPGRGDVSSSGYPGPLRLKVNFPAFPSRVGHREPLISTGRPGAGDIIYVEYLNDRVRLGLDHWNPDGPVSDPIRVNAADEHELIVSLGSLMPPGDATLYETDRRNTELRHWLLVALDGQIALSSGVQAYSSTPDEIFVGGSFIGGSSVEQSFTGRIRMVERIPLERFTRLVPPVAASVAWRDQNWEGAMGPIKMKITLPRQPLAVTLPLVSTGRPGAGDLLFVQRDGSGAVRFGLDHWGGGAVLSKPVPAGDGPMELVLSLGSLMPAVTSAIYHSEPRWAMLRNLAYVELNGQRMLSTIQDIHPMAGQATLAKNAIGSSVAAPYFTGNVGLISVVDPSSVIASSVQLNAQISNPDASWLGFPGPVRMRIRFPVGRVGQAEPLIVNGVNSAADFLFVRYLDERHVQLGFDHWGVGGPVSGALEIEPGSVQELLFSAGFLMPPESASSYGQRPALRRLATAVHLELNGKEVLSGTSPVFRDRLDRITVGANFAEGSTAGPGFSGEVLEISRVSPEDVLSRLPTVAH